MDTILLQESTKIKYSKKYKCPYCDKRTERDKLVYHIARVHEEMIPENYTSARIVFNMINKKEVGHCMICTGETEWNEDKARYNTFCKNTRCKDAYVKMARNRNIKSYGVPNLLQSKTHAVEQQKKMLSSRKISGTYKYSDGTIFEYTGNNEKHTLEFMDNVLNCISSDIQTPGPIIYYEYGGKKHFYIPDIYYVPYNLLIEVKDGGSNPNNRPMQEYREKQIAKEKAIIDQGVYNYLRLTNDNFSQLLLIFSELKMQLVDNHTSSEKIIRINEDGMVGAIGAALPNMGANNVYMTQSLQNNIMHYGITKDPTLNDVIEVKDGKVKKVNNKSMVENTSIYIFNASNSNDVYNNIIEMVVNNDDISASNIYELCTGKPLLSPDQISFDEWFIAVPNFYQSMFDLSEVIKESLLGNNGYCFDASDNKIKTFIDENGKYLVNTENGYRTRSISEKESFSEYQKSLIGGIDTW